MAEERKGQHGRAPTDPWVRFWRYVDGPTPTGCWPWTGATRRRGYGTFPVLLSTGRRYQMVATRFLWERLYGPIPAGAWVLHTCDNPPCVRPSHLFLGDARANAHDRMDKGRRVRPHSARRDWQSKGSERNAGERNGGARLTSEKVASIRARRDAGERIVDLAPVFGVAQSTISAVVNGKSWVNSG